MLVLYKVGIFVVVVINFRRENTWPVSVIGTPVNPAVIAGIGVFPAKIIFFQNEFQPIHRCVILHVKIRSLHVPGVESEISNHSDFIKKHF